MKREIGAIWEGYQTFREAVTCARIRAKLYGAQIAAGTIHIFKRDGLWHVGRIRR